MLNRWMLIWKRHQMAFLSKEVKGVGVVEVILILVGILTPYYGVGIRCIE